MVYVQFKVSEMANCTWFEISETRFIEDICAHNSTTYPQRMVTRVWNQSIVMHWPTSIWTYIIHHSSYHNNNWQARLTSSMALLSMLINEVWKNMMLKYASTALEWTQEDANHLFSSMHPWRNMHPWRKKNCIR